MPQTKKKDSFKPDSFKPDSFRADSFKPDAPYVQERPEDYPQYGQRSDILGRTPLGKALGPPAQQFGQAVQQFGEGDYTAGGLNVINSILGAAFSPLALAEQGIRQIPGIGEPLANAATLPFQAVAGAVKGGEGLISKGLGELGIPDPKSPTSEALSGLNQGLAQFLVPIAGKKISGKVLPKPPKPLYSEYKPTVAPEGLRTAGELQTELPLQPSFKKDMVQKLGGKDVETRFGKVGALSDADLTKIYQEAGLDKPAPLSEAPVSRGGDLSVRGPANEAQIAKQGKPSPKEVGGGFTNLVENLRNDLDNVLDNWSEARVNESGTGITSTPFRRNAVGGTGGKVSLTKSGFFDWLYSDAPFDTKVYGEAILKDVEWRASIEKLREANPTLAKKYGLTEKQGTPPPPPAKPPTVGTAELPPEASNPVAKIIQIIKEAKPVRGETERLYIKERRKRAAQLSQVFEKPEGEATLYKALATQKGELPKATFESARPKLTEQDIKVLFDKITTTKELRSFETLSTMNAFRDILEGRRVPGRYELGLLEKVFGEEFVGAVLEKRSFGAKFFENALDVGNLPRALMAGFDMSNPFRQSLPFTVGRGLRNPRLVKDAMSDMFRAFAKEENYKASQEQIRSRENAPLYDEFGVYFAEMGGRALELTAREEAFMSRLASNIPGIKHSNRAYVAYGNRIRADVFDRLTEDFKKTGLSPENNPDVWMGLADYVNKATGRGNLGKYGERIAPLLNTVGFSPRNLAAKFQLLNPAYYVKLPKQVRVEAIKDMLTLAGAGTTLLALAKTAGIEVEFDPRSTDFGKIKIGNTRIDPWGGFQQWLRFYAQLATGERKSTTTGQVRKLSKDVFPFESRGDLILGFAGQKLSPQASLVADLLRGETAIGEPLTFSNTVLERMTPMYLQDIQEAANDLGIAGAIGASIPGFFGVGVQTYKPRSNPFQPIGSDVLR